MKQLIVAIVLMALPLSLLAQSQANLSDASDVSVTLSTTTNTIRIVADEPISKVEVINAVGEVVAREGGNTNLGEFVVIPLAMDDIPIIKVMDDIPIIKVMDDIPIIKVMDDIPIIKNSYLVEVTTQSGEVIVKVVE